jgi:hypothetical protein
VKPIFLSMKSHVPQKLGDLFHEPHGINVQKRSGADERPEAGGSLKG